MRRWSPGETVVVRNIAHSDGTATNAMPSICVLDEAAVLALYVPDGTLYVDNYGVAPAERAAAIGAMPASAERAHVERRWSAHTLRLYPPDTAWAAWVFFDAGWQVQGWYGDLIAPYQRTAIGIDTHDHALDVMADAQRRWAWKDEAEFARRLDVGFDTAEHQEAVRRAGEAFVAALTDLTPPLDRDWPDWRPPADWTPRPLPSTWRDDMGTRFRRR